MVIIASKILIAGFVRAVEFARTAVIGAIEVAWAAIILSIVIALTVSVRTIVRIAISVFICAIVRSTLVIAIVGVAAVSVIAILAAAAQLIVFREIRIIRMSFAASGERFAGLIVTIFGSVVAILITAFGARSFIAIEIRRPWFFVGTRGIVLTSGFGFFHPGYSPAFILGEFRERFVVVTARIIAIEAAVFHVGRFPLFGIVFFH